MTLGPETLPDGAGPHVAVTGAMPDGFADVVSELASIVLGEGTLDSVLDLVTSLSRETISGVSAVSISLCLADRLETRHSTPDDAVEMDNVQYETHQGPCVATIDTGRPHNATLGDMEAEWPAFAPAARQHGIRRILSLPLQVRGETIGALNLYAEQPDAFAADGEEDRARLFAHHASIALANAAAYAAAEAQVRQLMEALTTRDVIGQAKGILMAREGCTSDRAFEILRQASQRTQRKLRDLAEEIVELAQRIPQ